MQMELHLYMKWIHFLFLSLTFVFDHQPLELASVLLANYKSFEIIHHHSPKLFAFYTGKVTMAVCGSLRSLFEKPLPENPSLIESLSAWNQMKPMKPTEPGSFAEMFGELYFQEKPGPGLLVADSKTVVSELDSKNGQMRENLTLDALLGSSKNRYRCDTKSNSGFSAKNSESLLMCTEGLGSESSDDVDDLMENGDDWRSGGDGRVDLERRRTLMANGVHDYTRSSWRARPAKIAKVFPPPISSIGKSGKPRVCLRPYREDGRFVLREMRSPCQEFLCASREDGRLKLHFVRPIEEGIEEENDHEEQEVQENVCGI